jgi:ribosomal protein S18 acetylase RimI-like enzyme
MTFHIRAYQDDLEALYEICLKTGNNGHDATNMYKDPHLLGHFYAAPYGVLCPETCLVLQDKEGVCGYIIGTADSLEFSRKTESEWWPALRNQFPLPKEGDECPDARIIRLIHAGYNVGDEVVEYPAHLHIDLLQRAQGRGQGKALMHTYLELLKNKRVDGVHLGVSAENERAVSFYNTMGFQTVKKEPWGYILGMKLK